MPAAPARMRGAHFNTLLAASSLVAISYSPTLRAEVMQVVTDPCGSKF